MLPLDDELRDKYSKLLTGGYCRELCFEALMHYQNLNEAMEYCHDNHHSFGIRMNRGEIKNVIDLLPSWMYHNYRELSYRYSDVQIIRALIVCNNRLNDANNLLEYDPIALVLYLFTFMHVYVLFVYVFVCV